ncbi:MAG: type IV secretion protein Rhs [Elusimicrobia bacterium]|nr:type IV secretion protein Rhs [Elusimicrobiota bacterium]
MAVKDGTCVIEVPPFPAGTDLDKNIEEARKHKGDLLWFYRQVRNKGPWDFKQKGKTYENFGNFHYGAVGRATGIPKAILLRAAGLAQKKADTSQPEFGSPFSGPPFGDDPRDHEMIKKGFEYFEQHEKRPDQKH